MAKDTDVFTRCQKHQRSFLPGGKKGRGRGLGIPETQALAPPRTCGSVTWAYTHDALDRLTTVTNTSGLAAAYTYDVLGTRIAKKVDTTITRFVWRSGHVIYETTGDGTRTYSYQWGLETDDLVAIHDHGSGRTITWCTTGPARPVGAHAARPPRVLHAARAVPQTPPNLHSAICLLHLTPPG